MKKKKTEFCISTKHALSSTHNLNNFEIYIYYLYSFYLTNEY